MSSPSPSLPDTPCPAPRLSREEEAREHRNLVNRRRRREITLVRMAHELHTDCNTEVFVLVVHNEEYKNVIYSSDPGEDFPRPFEKLKIMYPRPEINTPSDPQYSLRKALDRITAIRAREAGTVRANGARGIAGPRAANTPGHNDLDGRADMDGHDDVGDGVDGHDDRDSHDTDELGQPIDIGDVDGQDDVGRLSQLIDLDSPFTVGYPSPLDSYATGHNQSQPASLDGLGEFGTPVGLDDVAGPDHVANLHDNDLPHHTYHAAEPATPAYSHLKTQEVEGPHVFGQPVSREDVALSTGSPFFDDMSDLCTAEVDAAEAFSAPQVPGASGHKRAAPLDFYIPIRRVRARNEESQGYETVGPTTPPPRPCSPPLVPDRRKRRCQSRAVADQRFDSVSPVPTPAGLGRPGRGWRGRSGRGRRGRSGN